MSHFKEQSGELSLLVVCSLGERPPTVGDDPSTVSTSPLEPSREPTKSFRSQLDSTTWVSSPRTTVSSPPASTMTDNSDYPENHSPLARSRWTVKSAALVAELVTSSPSPTMEPSTLGATVRQSVERAMPPLPPAFPKKHSKTIKS